MNIQEIFFTKREIKNNGVFLYLKNDRKEKIGVILVKISDDYMFPIDFENSRAPIECIKIDGTLKEPAQETLNYHIDKIYKIASEQYIGEEVIIYIIKIKGEPNIFGFLAHPDELEK